MDNWFIHIDDNNRFCVIGSNVLNDELKAEMSPPLIYIDMRHWLAETAEFFYLLHNKNTSAENRAYHYQQLKSFGLTRQLVLVLQ